MIGDFGFFERIWPVDLLVPSIGVVVAIISLGDEQRRFREIAVVGLALNCPAIFVMAGCIAFLLLIGLIGPP